MKRPKSILCFVGKLIKCQSFWASKNQDISLKVYFNLIEMGLTYMYKKACYYAVTTATNSKHKYLDSLGFCNIREKYKSLKVYS